MSIEEALIAMPELEELRISDQWGRSFFGSGRIAGFDFRQILSFDDNKLVSVGISLEQKSDCEKFRDWLTKSLGPVKTTPKANGAYRYEWVTDRDVIGLDQGMPVPKSPERCSLFYLDRSLSDEHPKKY